jgi:hypothetical protein
MNIIIDMFADSFSSSGAVVVAVAARDRLNATIANNCVDFVRRNTTLEVVFSCSSSSSSTGFTPNACL